MPETIEKERLSEDLTFPWWVKKEHRARYLFASQYTKGVTVLDCACGTGEGSFLFSQEATSVRAVDISQAALDEATQRFQKSNLSFEIGSALTLPVPDAFSDVYISLETIEHIGDDQAYLKEAARIVKDQGIFICSTPNRHITNPGKSLSEKPANPFHIREYSPQELTHLLKQHFSKVELYGLNPNKPLKAKALRLLGEILPGHIGTRVHQLMKLVRFLFKHDSDYTFKKLSPEYEYEYLIAVCQK